MSDGGSVNVKVDPKTASVVLELRAPLAIAPAAVVLDPYQFVDVFGAALHSVGVTLSQLQRAALAQAAGAHVQ